MPRQISYKGIALNTRRDPGSVLIASSALLIQRYRTQYTGRDLGRGLIASSDLLIQRYRIALNTRRDLGRGLIASSDLL